MSREKEGGTELFLVGHKHTINLYNENSNNSKPVWYNNDCGDDKISETSYFEGPRQVSSVDDTSDGASAAKLFSDLAAKYRGSPTNVKAKASAPLAPSCKIEDLWKKWKVIAISF